MAVGRMYGDERITSCLKSLYNVADKISVVWTTDSTPVDKLDEVITLFFINLHLYSVA